MATFVSEASNLWIALDDKITVRFVNGKADIAATARRHGINKDELAKRLKESRYFGVRFWAAEEVQSQNAPPPPPPSVDPHPGDSSSNDDPPEDVQAPQGLPPYRTLSARAQELGLPYVGVKHEDLAASVQEAERLLGGQ